MSQILQAVKDLASFSTHPKAVQCPSLDTHPPVAPLDLWLSGAASKPRRLGRSDDLFKLIKTSEQTCTTVSLGAPTPGRENTFESIAEQREAEIVAADGSAWRGQMNAELKATGFLYCSRITFKTRSHFVFLHHLY